jgi:hypothetical protein
MRSGQLLSLLEEAMRDGGREGENFLQGVVIIELSLVEANFQTSPPLVICSHQINTAVQIIWFQQCKNAPD